MQIEAIYNKGIFELPSDIHLSQETFKVVIDFPADAVKKTRQESTNPLDLLLIKHPQDSWLRQMKSIEETVTSRKEQDLPELSLKQLGNIKAFSQTEELSPDQYLNKEVIPKPIDFIDLKQQQNSLRPKIEKNIHKVLAHGKYIMGPEVKELENRLADFAQVRHAVTCASGTDALLMVLMAYGVGPGDAVFTSPFTFIATAEVIKLLGATPVFVDIDTDTFNISVDKLESSIKEVTKAGRLKPKAVIPVDLFGLPCNYDKINSIASKNDLIVIEDAAQSFGAECQQPLP